ncbi:hypothetical protein AGOR_G00243330 [Albula goreensis]|uniref:Ubiquitin-like protease family profile domain-containing protein n=1 Tax=Albula goreensis TaxID=1534307 RepID=A0A8T3CKK1_9TELE|nr:hypothetical protein AGOR_G00243330 [Albula goreensis]
MMAGFCSQAVMGHSNVKRLQRGAICRTSSFAALHRIRLRLQARGAQFGEYRFLLRSLAFVGSRERGTRAHAHRSERTNSGINKSEVKTKGMQLCPESGPQPQKCAGVTGSGGTGIGKLDKQSTDVPFPDCALKPNNMESSSSADACAAVSEHPDVESVVDPGSLEPSSSPSSLNVAGWPADCGGASCATVLQAEQSAKQVGQCSSIQQRGLEKRPMRAGRRRKRALLLVARTWRPRRFDLRSWWWLRNSVALLPCKRRTSLPRTCSSQSAEAEALPCLPSLSTEARAQTGDGLQEQNRTTVLAPEGGRIRQGAEGTVARDHSTPKAPQLGQRPAPGHPAGRKRRSDTSNINRPEKSPKLELCGQSQGHRSERVTQTSLVNGSPATGEEAGPPSPSPAQASSPLQDHHYYKAKAGGPISAAGEDPQTEPAEGTGAQLSPDKITDQAIKELVHEFLEEFYGKHGSFTLLSKTDVLKKLNSKLNTDLKHRMSLICTEVNNHQAALASGQTSSYRVAYNKHTLTQEDLSTLDNQNWVNDQVINMYGELIMEAVNHKVHFFNSFFHRQLATKGYEGVRRWTKKVDLFTKNLLLIPIHLEIHWSLITVDVPGKTINFYDSQGIVFKRVIENILRYVTAEAKEKKQTVFQKGWKMAANKRIPQQRNDNDCGVFVLEYCKRLALGRPLHFSQGDMPKIRKRIRKELCDCQLTE